MVTAETNNNIFGPETSHLNSDIAEYLLDELDRKVTLLADWVLQSQKLTCFTGERILKTYNGISDLNTPSNAHMALV